MTKKFDSEKFDHKAALLCAESFKKLAEQFIDNIGKMPEGSFQDPKGLGDLVCSATNLAFALEIYLKTLHAQLKSSIPQIHDLSKLYNDLPLEVRTEIEDLYERSKHALPYGIRVSITLVNGPPEPPIWKNYNREAKGLPELLKRSADVFVSWRYIFVHEHEENDYEYHQFEYRLLVLACEALKAVILNHKNDVMSK